MATAPPSPAVFLRRRLVALGVLLLAVGGLVALFARGGDDPAARKAGLEF